MSTTNTQFNDWGAKLLSWTSSEAGEEENKNLSAFCNATDSGSFSQEERLKAITSTPEVLALAVTENKKVVVLHSIKNMGGHWSIPKTRLWRCLEPPMMPNPLS